MKNTKVAILISTKDRPGFLIRTLAYYYKMRSPHPVYISDSSNPENTGIIKSALEKLSDGLETNYHWYSPGFDNSASALSLVKEKYAVITGDDDYEIPSSLSKCAEFLENNPDYASAGGHGISFRLKTSGPYGEIARLADYPNYALESESASERLIDFLKKCFVITFSVNRVEHMKKIWVEPIPITTTWNELFQICYCATSGKSKLIDCLGIIRHIHDHQHYLSSMIDWLTEKKFHDYYATFRDHLAKKIVETDKVSIDQAKQTVKDAFWEYLQVHMANEKKGLRAKNEPVTSRLTLKSLRTEVGVNFPVLKTIYREYIRPIVSDKKQMHYEVTNPRSPYYEDFQHVADSFTGKDLKNE